MPVLVKKLNVCMHTYRIHINGLVQGVGFRPFVCRLAAALDINGWVSNTNNGVHIECNASPEKAQTFYDTIIRNPPANAIITHQHFEEIFPKIFSSFTIKESSKEHKPSLLLTPDIALCNNCRKELLNTCNKRYNYPFTTCLECGPRYSIITALPYDRENTTMNRLQMCDDCLAEYNDIQNSRHYSQTNSCNDCAIPLHLFNASNLCISSDTTAILEFIISALKGGCITGVKGIGGYLLLCDATNEASINTLRTRKQRPFKPFALLYKDIGLAGADVTLRSFEINALLEKSAPIVLCKILPGGTNGICKEAIAPGLDKIGVMLPYSPLLFLIAAAFGKPLIATSANISGSPILYKDAAALENLFEVADFLLTYERNIVAPQDDSVIQFTDSGQKIILRRSRGLAPNYLPNPFESMNGSILAMGAELKSAFALLDQTNLYISQYLGDQGTVESQTSYKETLLHITTLVKAKPRHILIDKHPGYFVSQYGKEIADEHGYPLTAIQHHKAHFGAVLAENNLFGTRKPVMGVTWDGTGYGDDGQIWGGEVFILEHNEMHRVAHLDYFSQLLGDKMSSQPRLSALSLLKDLPHQQSILQKHFSQPEWKYYQQLIQQPAPLLTSSMGRFLDGIASILGIRQFNTYEGEATMQLEAIARSCIHKEREYYSFPLVNNRLDRNYFLSQLFEDLQKNEDTALIAWKVFLSLAKLVGQLSNHFQIEQIAFSGGVFQNALLTDLLVEQLKGKKTLHFHQKLSPNDECIGFGQLACYSLMNNRLHTDSSKENKVAFQQSQFTH